MDMISIVSSVTITIPAIVGAASIIVQGIAALTKITPSTKDDEVVGRVAAGIAKVQRYLDVLALNLPANKARL